MPDFWSEIPEAGIFCNKISENIEDYKLFPEEKFIEIKHGILASTQIDRQGESFSFEQLKSFEEQINNRTLWFGVNHDPLIQPYARAIAAKLLYAPDTKIFALFLVTGCYDVNNYPKFIDIGIDLSKVEINDSDIPPFNLEKTKIKIGFNKQEISNAIVRELEKEINESPEFVEKDIDYRYRKAVDPVTTISIAIPIWLIIANPFSKKFLEIYAEEAAKHSIKIIKWIIKSIINKVNQIKNERVLIEYESPCRGCHFQYLIDTKDTNKITKATKLLYQAGYSSIFLYQNLKTYDVQKIIYKFDTDNEQWIPIHAITKKLGIISDKPVLIALDNLPGLSIGGRWGEFKTI